ncbi:MAG TPA: Wzz/FepE/Etk N-terminal domain-containing protein [Steroidobacteraceae bacterium]|nr:Wzz/FepE/Etk N-terminal domain-containing protein [Steroidobacteraceae bacterium]
MNDVAREPVQYEVSLVAMAQFLWRNILLIGGCMVLFGGAATALVIMATPKWRSEVVFSPASSSGGLGNMGGQLGGLAAIAGIELGGASKKTDEELAYLRSRGFTAQFIQRHDLLPVLFASRWDAQNKRWTGEPPTMGEAVKRFSNQVRQISEDRRTGIVTMSILWRDRFVAAQWANALLAEADDALRKRAIAELTRSIDYLKAESSDASVVEVQAAVYKVMESELKDAMLARTRDAYAFKVLDPAVAADPKDIASPKKVLDIGIGCAFGLLVGILCAAVIRRGPAWPRR